MPFSDQQISEPRGAIETSLGSSAASDWERRFLQDMKTKLDRFGTRTSMSPKQYATLMRLTKTQDRPAPPRDVAPLNQRRSSQPRKAPYTQAKRRKPKRTPYWMRRQMPGLIVLGVIGIALLASQDGSSVPRTVSEPETTSGGAGAVSASSIRAVDGDTVELPGYPENVRLVGFNTPEMFSPSCDRELNLGRAATSRLEELLRNASTVEFEEVACACKPGTHGTTACNYGRACGRLRADGQDVGDVLISEGLAARYICGPTGCPRPPGNWCG